MLTPITLLANQPGNTNQIDWYAAQASAGAPCDGVAQTLVSRQNYASTPGAWYGEDYEYPQTTFETAWSTIMLQKTSFVACVNNLAGLGKAGGRSSSALITLTWSAFPTRQLIRYNVPQRLVGLIRRLAPLRALLTMTNRALSTGQTYYYVLQPNNSGNVAVCTSESGYDYGSVGTLGTGTSMWP